MKIETILSKLSTIRKEILGWVLWLLDEKLRVEGKIKCDHGYLGTN